MTKTRVVTPTSGQKLAFNNSQLRSKQRETSSLPGLAFISSAILSAPTLWIGPTGVDALAPASANSEKFPRLFQSSVPRALARVSRLARPAAIQLRTCPAVTGPYSFPSPPMMVYMAVGETRTHRSNRVNQRGTAPRIGRAHV